MRLGIIDIGYNAIRAVVHESNTIGSPEIFNNKFKNDILTLLMQEELDIKYLINTLTHINRSTFSLPIPLMIKQKVFCLV